MISCHCVSHSHKYSVFKKQTLQISTLQIRLQIIYSNTLRDLHLNNQSEKKKRIEFFFCEMRNKIKIIIGRTQKIECKKKENYEHLP